MERICTLSKNYTVYFILGCGFLWEEKLFEVDYLDTVNWLKFGQKS